MSFTGILDTTGTSVISYTSSILTGSVGTILIGITAIGLVWYLIHMARKAISKG